MWVGRPLTRVFRRSATLSPILYIFLHCGKVLGTKGTCPRPHTGHSLWRGWSSGNGFGQTVTGSVRNMAGTVDGLAARLGAVPDVDMDHDGTFKYILIKVTAGSEHKYIVRGYDRAEYHADIYDEIEPGLRALGLKINCVGGGRIKHMPKAKSIFVYGYSQGFGRADHGITTDVLKRHFKGYASITWSNEGY